MSAVTEVGGTPVPDNRPDVFGEFCAAGLWPGLARKLAGQLAGAGITGPELVTADRLKLIDGVSGERAEWLAASFLDARPCYETAQLLAACQVPARFAGPAVAMLGRSAQDQLREDPWRLLAVSQIRPDQADWFARKLLREQASPQDQRRGRALVSYLLARAARDGHTAVPAGVIASALARFRIEDPGAAIAAAVDEGGVLPFEADPGEMDAGQVNPGDLDPGDLDAGEDADAAREQFAAGEGPGDGGDGEQATAGLLLALARYAMAEEAVAEGLQRLAALAEPLDPAGPDDAEGADPAPEPGGAAGPDPAAEANLAADADPAAGPDPAAEADPAPGSGPGAGLDPAQQAAVQAVAGHGVSVLTGGPGTGKSRTVAAVVAMAAERGLTVALAAPTGRAAKRLEELTGAPATTVHRLLGAQAGDRADGPGTGPGGPPAAGGEAAWVFSRNEEWPLDADLVVVDEASMLDAELATALVEACPDGARLLLVGDPAQLPSIGPGRVLGDIIDSGAVPVTELTRLYRQRDGGVIARLATAVRGGALPRVDSPDREVVVLPARSSGDAAHRVMQLVTDSIPRALGIPAADIQVITPVHKGPAGTIALNRVLKEQLNPGPGAHGGFDPGDRVVSVANHADAGFANGEVGTVLARGDGGLQVAFPAAPVSVPDKFLSDLRHGWALTVHRAQGSEWPAVIAVFPAEAAGMLSRPLVYTALTRAQRHLSVVHGAGPALARAVSTVGEPPRVTRLAALLAGL
jgi:exodeoxyribonuclease V alpha subunit